MSNPYPHAPGSQSALKAANRQRLLDALEAAGGSSQAELARVTGLSPASVSNMVRAMTLDGALTVRHGRANGRPSRIVELAVDRRRLGVGVDLGRHHLRVVIGSADGEVAAELITDLPDNHDPDHTLELLKTMLDRAITQAGAETGQLCGVTVGLPAPVDDRGTVGGGTILARWTGLPLGSLLSDLIALPVAVENDANLGALAMAHLTPLGSSVVFVKVATGIGAGIVVNGELIRGWTGTAGEIGHLTIDPRLAVVCRCGRRGCLETLASSEAIRAATSAAHGQHVGLDEVLQMVATNNPVATEVLEEAGEMLGRGLAWLATTLNPQHIVIGGPLVPVEEALLTPIRRGFRRAALPIVASGTEICMSPLGERAEALGALVSALRRQAPRR